MYHYYYFSDKKDRNAFVDDVDGDGSCRDNGVSVVNIANDVTISAGQAFLVVLAVTKSGPRVLDALRRHFEKWDSHMEYTVNGSPYDY